MRLDVSCDLQLGRQAILLQTQPVRWLILDLSSPFLRRHSSALRNFAGGDSTSCVPLRVWTLRASAVLLIPHSSEYQPPSLKTRNDWLLEFSAKYAHGSSILTRQAHPRFEMHCTADKISGAWIQKAGPSDDCWMTMLSQNCVGFAACIQLGPQPICVNSATATVYLWSTKACKSAVGLRQEIWQKRY